MGRTIYLELVAGTRMAGDLAAGGLFVQDHELALQDDCTIVVFNEGGQLELPAKVVYCDGNGGVGLELRGFGPELRGMIEELLASAPSPDQTAASAKLATGSNEHELPGGDQILDGAHEEHGHERDGACEEHDREPSPDGGPANEHVTPDDLAAASDLADTLEAGGGEVVARTATEDIPPPELYGEVTEEERAQYKSLHLRLRGLNLAEQIKRARSGDATERMLLERMYGKNVWEPLLRNPRLTAPEVARIARMGALPRPLIEVIFNNSAWLQIPEVRRALLTNPRLGTDQIIRVLRLMPKHELKLAAVQTAYPFAVRDVAKRLVKESAP